MQLLALTASYVCSLVELRAKSAKKMGCNSCRRRVPEMRRMDQLSGPESPVDCRQLFPSSAKISAPGVGAMS